MVGGMKDVRLQGASMKVPPKRKGNTVELSPYMKTLSASMKVPPKRKGNATPAPVILRQTSASMKVPPKRKGNPVQAVHDDKRAVPQ